MSNWKKVRLGDISKNGRGYYGIGASAVPYSSDKYTYLRITDINDDGSLNMPDLKSVDAEGAEDYLLYPNDVVFARTGNSTGRNYFYDGKDGQFVYAGFLIKFSLDETKIYPKYVKYFLQTDEYRNWVASFNTGSTRGNINAKTYADLEIPLLPPKSQERIVGILGALDDKIELNNRINKNLEEQASALFKRWFVDFEFPNTDGNPYKSSGGKFTDSPLGQIPDGWRVDSLVEIANYLNGLAMQKFRPLDGEIGIPVLKIKELGQRDCNISSDLCSPSIKSEYIINNGDVIFSWSGTLMIDIWCGGLCGLNQHLFKVTSNKYPKWFYYMWTNEYLQEFIRIAKDKAVTMGHIKREHLVKSQVLIPEEGPLSLMTNIMSPMFEEMINRRVENRKLAELRDFLLPKLMNNEIKI